MGYSEARIDELVALPAESREERLGAIREEIRLELDRQQREQQREQEERESQQQRDWQQQIGEQQLQQRQQEEQEHQRQQLIDTLRSELQAKEAELAAMREAQAHMQQ